MISNAVTHGDTFVLCVSAGSAAGAAPAVSDTQSNTYALVQHSSTDQATWQYTCQNATALTTSDSVTVTFTSSGHVQEPRRDRRARHGHLRAPGPPGSPGRRLLGRAVGDHVAAVLGP